MANKIELTPQEAIAAANALSGYAFKAHSLQLYATAKARYTLALKLAEGAGDQGLAAGLRRTLAVLDMKD
jgi:hypothetical protein